MKKLKAFWYVYSKSLFNVGYYKDLLKVRKDFSLKYFFMLTLFASVIATISLSFQITPRIKSNMHSFLDQLIEIYPDDLIIMAENGMWDINKEEPYTLPTPQMLKVEGTYFPENFIVFDHEGTINDLYNLDTFMIVNSANLVTRGNQGKVEAYPIDSIPDGEINKELVTQNINNIRNLIKFVPVAVALMSLIGTVLYFTVFRLAYLVVVALALLAYGYLMGVKTTFKTYYKIALHALTLPITIELIFIIIRGNLSADYWVLGLNVIFGIVVVNHLKNVGAFKKAAAK